ncbi:MAG TPA: tagaturonate epimerase family protein [Bryobacteraceae bacterium]|nr:tagaturonate epimerase family protein [Bryobacteraceae bacterium]HOQ43938.1 tagaturonate epimerase family protein [Bryobacteraceae bacterium]HPU72916.1 tagaturonate epimerase family protein [Bryobacteraceae bacterium]
MAVRTDASGLRLGKYSLGVGDRFAQQARAQLRACIEAAAAGIEIIPVWNKSNREHNIVGSEPAGVREAAEAAVRELGWKFPFHVDADHIGLQTVDQFLESSDFFTLDVADAIGRAAEPAEVEAFAARHPELCGTIELEGIAEPLTLTREDAMCAAEKYLGAVREAGRIYRHIAERKGTGTFITEVSMDESDAPQTPPELLVILAAISDEGIPAQTIAPKFSGRFNKGVDYVGAPEQFEREFRADVAVIAHAVARFGLPDNLKLSVHTGSDKFSIYPAIRRVLEESGAGVHLKTAGTTWLEELIGLAEAGGEALDLAKEVYRGAYERRSELCGPYAAVIDIDAARLPSPGAVAGWSSEQFAAALRHDPACPDFNPHFRQLLHVGYKIAAEMGSRYLEMLRAAEEPVSRNVTYNLYQRHIRPLFPRTLH